MSRRGAVRERTSAQPPPGARRRRARRVGRPRDERAAGAILAATLELMAERSVRDLRIDDVARRAGVAKTTLYRRYRSKDELVTAAVKSLVSEIEIPDTGCTSRDVHELMRGAIAVYRDPAHAGVMPGLIDAMREDRRLARTVREGFLRRRRRALRAVLERGVQRGELAADLDYELALDVFAGPLFYRLLVTGAPIDERLADGVAEVVLRGFAARPPQPPRPRQPHAGGRR